MEHERGCVVATIAFLSFILPNVYQELVGGDGTWDLVLRPALLRKLFKPQCDK